MGAGEGPQATPSVRGLGLGVLPRILSSPEKAFRALRLDPQWIGPFLIVLALVGVAGWVRLPQDLALRFDTTEALMERMGADEKTLQEALAQVPDPEDVTGSDVALQVVSSVGSVAVVLLVGTLVFWGISRAFGAEPGFSQASAVFWTAHLAQAAGYLALALLVRAADTVEVSLSPAALVPGLEWGSAPYLALNGLDPFAVATLYLLAAGARWTFGASRGTGWGVAGTYWGLAFLVGFAVQLAGSWAMGRL